MSMTTEAPPRKMRRYFFGYHLVNGEPYAMMWMMDDGWVVGGIPHDIVGEVVEISEEEFEKGELIPLEKQYPYDDKKGFILLPDAKDWIGG